MNFEKRNLPELSEFEKTSDWFVMSDLTREPDGITRNREDSMPGANDPHWRGPLSCLQRDFKARWAATAEFGDWVSKLTEWHWFGTYTFDRACSDSGAHYMFKRYMEWLEERTKTHLYVFAADEYGALNGRLHLHALISHHRQTELPAYCGTIRKDKRRYQCCATHGWPNGYARVFEVDMDRINSETKHGASYYVSKYVVKANGHYDLLGFDHLIDLPPF